MNTNLNMNTEAIVKAEESILSFEELEARLEMAAVSPDMDIHFHVFG